MTEAPETIWAALGDPEYPDEGGEFLLNRGDWVDEITPVKYRRADLPPKVNPLVWIKLQNGVSTTVLPITGKLCRVKIRKDGSAIATIQGEFERNFGTGSTSVEYVQAYFEALVLECIE